MILFCRMMDEIYFYGNSRRRKSPSFAVDASKVRGLQYRIIVYPSFTTGGQYLELVSMIRIDTAQKDKVAFFLHDNQSN